MSHRSQIRWNFWNRSRNEDAQNFWFSAKNDHFSYFWFSNFFSGGIKKLYLKTHLHTVKISFAEYTETLGIAKKWLFWPNFLFFFRLTSFLNRFQKFQRIWVLWRKDFFHTKIEKKFWDLTHPNGYLAVRNMEKFLAFFANLVPRSTRFARSNLD